MSFPIQSEASKSHLIKLRVDGTGTTALTGPGRNLCALTDNGTGDYTITFSPALSEPPMAIPVALTAGVNVNLYSAPTESVVRFLSKSSAEKAATLSLNGIKFHSNLRGVDGNDITIQITPGATAGSEVVTSTSAGAITIQVETGVSTATQVYAALKAVGGTSSAVDAFVGYELITGATTWATASAAPLAGGLDVGDAIDADFDVLCLIDKL